VISVRKPANRFYGAGSTVALYSAGLCPLLE
jgi:hypothetical protein